ncbi:hypothetical protein N7454_001687 [Penicillium verhagenii]|nr:hypothetical protein N7454_001687 [Penicillium verhagenii]
MTERARRSVLGKKKLEFVVELELARLAFELPSRQVPLEICGSCVEERTDPSLAALLQGTYLAEVGIR